MTDYEYTFILEKTIQCGGFICFTLLDFSFKSGGSGDSGGFEFLFISKFKMAGSKWRVHNGGSKRTDP